MNTFSDVISIAVGLTQTAVYLLMAVAVFYFLWGLVGYLKNSGDVKSRDDSKKFMIYGLIGLFVMVGMWGLVEILTDTFGFSGIGIPQIRI